MSLRNLDIRIILTILLVFIVGWALVSWIVYKDFNENNEQSRKVEKKRQLNQLEKTITHSQQTLDSLALSLTFDINNRISPSESNHNQLISTLIGQQFNVIKLRFEGAQVTYLNQSGELIKHYKSDHFYENNHIINKSKLATSIQVANGITNIECQKICYLMKLSSILPYDDKFGYLQVGLPLRKFLDEFSKQNQLDVFSFIATSNDYANRISINNQPFYLEYASDDKLFSLLMSSINRLIFDDFKRIQINSNYYDLNLIEQNFLIDNTAIKFLIISDVSNSVKSLMYRVFKLVTFMLVIFLISFLIIQLILKKLIVQIQDFGKVLPLIGMNTFHKARSILQKNIKQTRQKGDEMAQLFSATSSLNDVTQALYQQIDSKNKQLSLTKENLTNSNILIDNLINTSNAIIITCDRELRITNCNSYTSRFLDEESSNLIGKEVKSVLRLSDKSHKEIFVDTLQTKNTNLSIKEAYLTDKVNQVHDIKWQYRFINELQQILIIGVDISDVKKKEIELKNFAEKDSITGLLNRRKFLDTVQKQINRHSQQDDEFSVAILYIDIDHFKHINDKYGHEIGNKVIVAVSVLIKHYLKSSDYAARFGGDEFVVAMFNRSKQEIEKIASKLLEESKDIFINDNGKLITIKTSMSIGINMSSDKNVILNKLVYFADAAMYENKRIRKGAYHFYNGEESFLLENKILHEWRLRIQDLIDKDQFTCHFQPIYRTNSQIPVQYEVLARINCPELLPRFTISQMIRYAERTQLVLQIDRIVIDKALAKASLRHDITIMINLSNVTIKYSNIAEYILERMRHYQFPAENLIIEITETVQIEDFGNAVSFIRILKSNGIKIALDDYGVGYTSLTYLTKLPIDFLKLDISLIHLIDSDERTVVIVKSIKNLADQLGIKIIAEGVETKSQAQVLNDIGVYAQQGFFYGKSTEDFVITN